jgi:hypothetical protein
MNLVEEIRNERRWFRRCLGILTYHTLKQQEFENIRGAKWRVCDTAEKLGMSCGYVSESLLLAKAFPKFDGRLEKMTREKALRFLRYENG